MNKSILITGRAAPVTTELAMRAAAKGFTLATAPDAPPDSGNGIGELDERVRQVSWTPALPISARGVVQEVCNAFEQIDEALVVCAPLAPSVPFHELSPAVVEDAVDRAVNGALYISKELISYFSRRGSGVLSFVLHQPERELRAPLDRALLGAFERLAEGLFELYGNEPMVLRGFRSAGSEAGEFAEHVITYLQEEAPRGNGKWLRHSSRSSLFAFGS